MTRSQKAPANEEAAGGFSISGGEMSQIPEAAGKGASGFSRLGGEMSQVPHRREFFREVGEDAGSATSESQRMAEAVPGIPNAALEAEADRWTRMAEAHARAQVTLTEGARWQARAAAYARKLGTEADAARWQARGDQSQGAPTNG